MFKHAWRIVFLLNLDKRLRELRKRKEADRRRREAEIPEQRCARLDRQKAYCQKRKASDYAETESAITSVRMWLLLTQH